MKRDVGGASGRAESRQLVILLCDFQLTICTICLTVTFDLLLRETGLGVGAEEAEGIFGRVSPGAVKHVASPSI